MYILEPYNDTCEYANLIIPSSSFYQKDVRLSYGHEYKSISNIVKKKPNTITNYDWKFLINSLVLKNKKMKMRLFHIMKIIDLEEFETFEFNGRGWYWTSL